MSILSRLFGDKNAQHLKTLQPLVSKINSLEPETEKLNNEQLKAKTKEFKSRLTKGETLDDILPEAFACVREAAKRTLGQRHFDVQLLGGIVLHRGEIAEMRTGEGKTLSSTLPLYLNALTGAGAHLVTVNDYLAKRDTVWMGQVYEALGISVSSIQHDAAFIYDSTHQETRNKKQETNKSQSSNSKSQSGEDLDKERDEKGNFEVVEEFLRPCTRAEAYQADITYGTNNEFGFDYLRDNLVHDQKDKVGPGRMTGQQQGFNYAIVDEVDSILIDEARTPLIISGPAEESADMYNKFSQLVKTLKENEDYNIEEKQRAANLTEAGIARVEKSLGMGNIYTQGGIKMVHHLEQALRAETLFKKDKDYVVKEGEVIIVDEFTGRMMPGRRYSEGLHQAIEAKEGAKVQRESITLATVTFQNYFRLYKKLAGMTGTAETSAEEFHKVYNLDVTVVPTNKEAVRADHTDKVYKNEQGKFKAVVSDVKARHEKGQPVLIGTVSIEKNEILAEMLEREGIPYEMLNAKNHEKEGSVIAQAGRLAAVTLATNMAGRGVDIVLGGNPATKETRQEVLNLGGVHVIGTERHDARRIDNQLRGRSGRQGDPGSSQFYVSMEDDVMRIFGSNRVKFMMEKMGIPDDMPIENKMVAKAIESAQTKVEGQNFDIRKHLLEYDDVINKQRETIYRKRDEILALTSTTPEGGQSVEPEGEIHQSRRADETEATLKQKILELIDEEIEEVVNFNMSQQGAGIKEIHETISTIFPLSDQDKKQAQELKSAPNLIEHFSKLAQEKYDELKQKINSSFGPSDKLLVTSDAPTPMTQVEKSIYLRSIDTLWLEHMQALDYLKTGIGLRGYGQRDPLVEYKKESFKSFQELLFSIRKQVVYSIFKVGLGVELSSTAVDMAQKESPKNIRLTGASKTMEKGSGLTTNGIPSPNGRRDSPISPGHGEQVDKVQPKPRDASGKKVGRNDPCLCGSGKKYKKCCGR